MANKGTRHRPPKKGQTVEVKQHDGTFYPATVLRVGRHKAQVNYPPRGKVAWVSLKSIRPTGGRL